MALTPRTHNLTSYTGAAIALPLAVLAFAAPSLAAGWWAFWPLLSPSARVALVLWCAHFARRALESALVHRYSKPTFPVSDALQEYVYYWGFAGWIGWTLTSVTGPVHWELVGMFALAELGNATAHWQLAALRPSGGGARAVPQTRLFSRVSCPHYFFEVSTWWLFFALVPSWASGSFAALVTIILGLWARQRHSKYRAEFPDYPRQRKALLPFIW